MEPEVVISLQSAEIKQGQIPILTEVTFDVRASEFVYLIGRTGMGKSSLLRTLYADIPPGGGEVKVAGYDLNAIKRSEVPMLRRKLGIIFQDFQLLTDRSVAENLEFVLKATGWKEKYLIDERIREILIKVGLETKDFRKPYELSGGEQQRLGIGRALLNNPECIIADEPTGNLDPESSQEIIQLLKDISKQGTSVLMATHDFLLIEKNPERLLKIEAGKVLDLGSVLF